MVAAVVQNQNIGSKSILDPEKGRKIQALVRKVEKSGLSFFDRVLCVMTFGLAYFYFSSQKKKSVLELSAFVRQISLPSSEDLIKQPELGIAKKSYDAAIEVLTTHRINVHAPEKKYADLLRTPETYRGGIGAQTSSIRNVLDELIVSESLENSRIFKNQVAFPGLRKDFLKHVIPVAKGSQDSDDRRKKIKEVMESLKKIYNPRVLDDAGINKAQINSFINLFLENERTIPYAVLLSKIDECKRKEIIASLPLTDGEKKSLTPDKIQQCAAFIEKEKELFCEHQESPGFSRFAKNPAQVFDVELARHSLLQKGCETVIGKFQKEIVSFLKDQSKELDEEGILYSLFLIDLPQADFDSIFDQPRNLFNRKIDKDRMKSFRDQYEVAEAFARQLHPSGSEWFKKTVDEVYENHFRSGIELRGTPFFSIIFATKKTQLRPLSFKGYVEEVVKNSLGDQYVTIKEKKLLDLYIALAENPNLQANDPEQIDKELVKKLRDDLWQMSFQGYVEEVVKKSLGDQYDRIKEESLLGLYIILARNPNRRANDPKQIDQKLVQKLRDDLFQIENWAENTVFGRCNDRKVLLDDFLISYFHIHQFNFKEGIEYLKKSFPKYGDYTDSILKSLESLNIDQDLLYYYIVLSRCSIQDVEREIRKFPEPIQKRLENDQLTEVRKRLITYERKLKNFLNSNGLAFLIPNSRNIFNEILNELYVKDEQIGVEIDQIFSDEIRKNEQDRLLIYFIYASVLRDAESADCIEKMPERINVADYIDQNHVGEVFEYIEKKKLKQLIEFIQKKVNDGTPLFVNSSILQSALFRKYGIERKANCPLVQFALNYPLHRLNFLSIWENKQSSCFKQELYSGMEMYQKILSENKLNLPGGDLLRSPLTEFLIENVLFLSRGVAGEEFFAAQLKTALEKFCSLLTNLPQEKFEEVVKRSERWINAKNRSGVKIFTKAKPSIVEIWKKPGEKLADSIERYRKIVEDKNIDLDGADLLDSFWTDLISEYAFLSPDSPVSFDHFETKLQNALDQFCDQMKEVPEKEMNQFLRRQLLLISDLEKDFSFLILSDDSTYATFLQFADL